MSEHEDMMERLETADTVPPPTPPTPLTREQVEHHADQINHCEPEYIADHVEMLVGNDAALRQALAQQAQEVDIVSADLSEARHQIGLLQQRIDTHCMTEAELRQQVATIETNAADNGTLFRAVLNEKLTLAQEVVKYAEEAQGYLVKIEHLADQLAAMTAERDSEHESLLTQLKANVGLAAKVVELEAVVQAYHSREELHEGLKNKTLLTQQLAASQQEIKQLKEQRKATT